MEEMKGSADRLAMGVGVSSPWLPWSWLPSLSTIVSGLSLFWMILRMIETRIIARLFQRLKCKNAQSSCPYICPHDCDKA